MCKHEEIKSEYQTHEFKYQWKSNYLFLHKNEQNHSI